MFFTFPNEYDDGLKEASTRGWWSHFATVFTILYDTQLGPMPLLRPRSIATRLTVAIRAMYSLRHNSERRGRPWNDFVSSVRFFWATGDYYYIFTLFFHSSLQQTKDDRYDAMLHESRI